ncbi:hypothetical protein MASR2M54_08390 [Aliarcobacter cryaerophilus]
MEKIILIITICTIIMISPLVSKLIKAPVVVVEIILGLFCGYIGLIYDDETLKLVAKFGFIPYVFSRFRDKFQTCKDNKSNHGFKCNTIFCSFILYCRSCLLVF